MELGLSLGGDTNNNNNGSSSSSKPPGLSSGDNGPDRRRLPGLELGFCMALGANSNDVAVEANDEEDDVEEEDDDQTSSEHTRDDPLQLALLPRAAVPPRWSSENGSSGSSGNLGVQPPAAAAAAARGFDVNRFPLAAEEATSPNSAASTFPMDFSLLRGGGSFSMNAKDSGVGANDVVEGERGSSRASDEDDNGLNSRKKLRLSKEQSAFLEESFKEHNTLNPKQKLALAKQLNLRPRQVEVWFQNRRARTKLKQTEVDCEYLKRCCETLTEDNRRLHKELQELRALKASNPFYMQLPATTLTMCPSCERVATTSTSTAASSQSPAAPTTVRPRFLPVAHSTSHPHHQSAAS